MSARRHAAALVAALLPLAACGDATAPAPDGPPAPREFTAPPALLDAVGDAEARSAAALAAGAREPVRAALAELRAALDAGHRARAARAAESVRALLTETDPTGDAADRTAIAVLVDVALLAARSRAD